MATNGPVLCWALPTRRDRAPAETDPSAAAHAAQDNLLAGVNIGLTSTTTLASTCGHSCSCRLLTAIGRSLTHHDQILFRTRMSLILIPVIFSLLSPPCSLRRRCPDEIFTMRPGSPGYPSRTAPSTMKIEPKDFQP